MTTAETASVTDENVLSGREVPMSVPDTHFVLDTPLRPPWPEGMEEALFAFGCFWGCERLFWQLDGVHSTSVGYAGGVTPNPTYPEVCTGRTGHAETVRVVFDPKVVSYGDLLRVFWENHDPTQGMRQGNDVGTQYRSALYPVSAEQRRLAEETRKDYAERLRGAGYGEVTTEIEDAPPFYYAEEYHQQYLAKNPDGYCGIRGTGVSCAAPAPVGS